MDAVVWLMRHLRDSTRHALCTHYTYVSQSAAGFFSSINQTRYSYQLVNAAFGGHEYWVGPGKPTDRVKGGGSMRCVTCPTLIAPPLLSHQTGAAAFIKTYSFTRRLVNYRTNPYGWVVAGTYIAGAYKATNTCVLAAPSHPNNYTHSVHVHHTHTHIFDAFCLSIYEPGRRPS